MSKSVYNFCAGPAMLPAQVMQQAKEEFLDWNGLGVSVMEISHRSKEYIAMAEQAERDLRELMNISDDYAVLFLHGGGRGQFSSVPLNILPIDGKVDYIVTGSWSAGAVKEGKKWGDANIAADIAYKGSDRIIPASSTWQLSDDASYVHYCPNETVDGVEFQYTPKTDKPLVADMSSCILSREIDVNDYGVIYAGAQKNIGPSGLSIVIVRKDLLGNARSDIPCIFDYQAQINADSMLNTPPTYAWYLAGLVFKWLKAKGGVSAIEAQNVAKAEHLYQFVDTCDFYQSKVAASCRSRMNVPFYLKDEPLNGEFLEQAQKEGLLALKGHRSVGGMRASIYNAMPLEGVVALTDFMDIFARRYG